jgi:hypothetical protein
VRRTPPELVAVAAIEVRLRLPLQPTVGFAAARLNLAVDVHGKWFRLSRMLEMLAEETSDLDAPSLATRWLCPKAFSAVSSRIIWPTIWLTAER